MVPRPNFHPYISLLQWYPFKASPSAELLEAYAKDVDAQIEQSIQAYRNDSKEEELHNGYDAPPEIIRHHRGIDDQSWDLHDVFEEYFPNLQRASTVLTLFAFFERELEDLCSLVQSAEGYKIAFRDVYGGGIERAVTYLEKVCGIDTGKNSVEWAEVKAIQAVRGLIAHGGRADLKQNAKVRDAISESPYLSYTDELKVAPEYPAYVITAHSRYFGLLHRSIRVIYATKLAALGTSGKVQAAAKDVDPL